MKLKEAELSCGLASHNLEVQCGIQEHCCKIHRHPHQRQYALQPTPYTCALDHTLPKVALYVPKRMLTIVVADDAVTKVVRSIIRINQTGNRGDGKIFVLP